MNRQIALLLVALALASVVANWLMREPPPEPSLVSASPGRCVVDLVRRPTGDLVCELDGQAVRMPGHPERWLIAENADGKVIAGWAATADGHPAEPIVVSDQPGRVSAYPLPGVRDGVGVEAWKSHDPAQGKSTLIIRPAKPSTE